MSVIRGLLLLGRFRSFDELKAMSPSDQRNTLIVELSNRSNQPVAHYQAFDDIELAGKGAVLVYLREAKIRTDAELKTMSDDDQRNTLIVEVRSRNVFVRTERIQALDNMDLVLSFLSKDRFDRFDKARPFSFIRGVLLAGRFRRHSELNIMEPENQRNTLIVELANHTSQLVRHFQAFDDAALAGKGAVMVFLREAKIRTDAALKTMSDDDQRNTAIVVINALTGLPVPQLQGLNNLELISLALGSFSSLIRDGFRASLIRGILLLGRFRTQDELNTISRDNHRNTLIVELAGRTNQSVPHYQAFNDRDLAGKGALLVYLREAKIRTDVELKNMSDDDMRNTLIVVLQAQTNRPISQLQALADLDLALLGFGTPPAFIRGVLLVGRFRTQDQLNTMEPSEQRATLILLLNSFSNQSAAHYRELNDEELAGRGAVLVYLREAKIRTDIELRNMSDDDQRNMLIVVLQAQTNLPVPVLQGLTNHDLIRCGLGDLTVFTWEDDPRPAPPHTLPVVFARDFRPVPDLTVSPLAIRLKDPGFPPTGPLQDTPALRYWVAAETLARTTTFWRGIEGAANPWRVPESDLPVHLNDGVGLNAQYTRGGPGDNPGLSFFSDTVDNVTYFSGESPDIVSHECGHAVLDALRPDISNSASIEAAAFHESFGDLTAIFSLLQLDFVCADLIAATGGQLYQSSRVSRLAEQLGFAIRQRAPNSVDSDCLRNAFNSFVYTDPTVLPFAAPASELSRESHSFSRIFTSAIFEALAGTFILEGGAQGPAQLLAATRKMATLLIASLKTVAGEPLYLQLAEKMKELATARFGPAYSEILRAAFTKRNILILFAVILADKAPSANQLAGVVAALPARDDRFVFDHVAYGLRRPLLVIAPEIAETYQDTSTATGYRAKTLSREESAKLFVDDLFRRGNVDLSIAGVDAPETRSTAPLTHYLLDTPDGFELRRRIFDCGFHHTNRTLLA